MSDRGACGWPASIFLEFLVLLFQDKSTRKLYTIFKATSPLCGFSQTHLQVRRIVRNFSNSPFNSKYLIEHLNLVFEMIKVTCALIVKDNKILATRRSHSMHLAGKWEFPGGKIEEGETAEACIVREIQEELGITVRPEKQLKSVEHHYCEKSIRLIPFRCVIVKGAISLAEHDQFLWIKNEALLSLDWAEADRKLIEMNDLT